MEQISMEAEGSEGSDFGVMPYSFCITCGEIIVAGSYCPAHLPIRASRTTPGRGSGSASSKFRAAVLVKAGHRCEVVVDGVRCTATLDLEAHHVVPLVKGGSNEPGNGRAVCRRHHRLLEAATRAA